MFEATDNQTEPTEEESPLAPFRVKDAASADWVLSKLAAIESEKQTITAQFKQRIIELENDAERLMFRFSAELEAFARTEAENRRRKTITLLHGSLCLRTSPARVVIASQEDALTTAKAVLPEAVQTVEKLDTRAFAKFAEARLQETGELLPGVEMTEATETFSVRLPKPGKASEEQE